MTGRIHIARIGMSLAVTVPDELVEGNMGYWPGALGETLAQRVIAYVDQTGLGYFPAMDYFRSLPEVVDPALLHLIDEMGAFSLRYARSELRRRLSRVFSQTQVQHTQCLGYALPRVRRGPQAHDLLANHYAPNALRLDLLLSTVEKKYADGLEELATTKVNHWAKDAFGCFEIRHVRFVGFS